VEQTLRSHSWNCAKRRIKLSPLVEKPAFDWGNQFQLPGDWLRNIQVGLLRQGTPGAWVPGDDYLVEGRRILSDMPELPLVYFSNLTKESDFDAALTYAMTLGMAAALAYPITKSTSVQQAMEAKLAQILKMARNEDGQDDPPQDLGDSPLYAARFGTFPLIPGRT
jgi:hypothetical protein